jgi:hypothetical protein
VRSGDRGFRFRGRAAQVCQNAHSLAVPILRSTTDVLCVCMVTRFPNAPSDAGRIETITADSSRRTGREASITTFGCTIAPYRHAARLLAHSGAISDNYPDLIQILVCRDGQEVLKFLTEHQLVQNLSCVTELVLIRSTKHLEFLVTDLLIQACRDDLAAIHV